MWSDARRRERAIDVELALHGAAVEVLEHHVVVALRRDAEVEDLDRVVGESTFSVDARLAREPLQRGVVGRQVRLEQLDRDLAVHREVMRAEHRAHAAFAEQRIEPIAPVEDDADQRLPRSSRHATRRARSACRS